MKKQKIYIVSLFILVFVFLVGYLIFATKSNLKSDKAGTNKQEQIKTQDTTDKTLQKIADDAGRSGDIDSCSSIKDANLNQECLDNAYLRKSLNLRDITYCSKIKLEIKKTVCEDTNNFLKGVLEKNKPSCEKVKDENMKKECINQLDPNYLQSKLNEQSGGLLLSPPTPSVNSTGSLR